MERVNQWLSGLERSEAGSLLIFLAVFLARVAIDEWFRRRDQKRAARGKRKANG